MKHVIRDHSECPHLPRDDEEHADPIPDYIDPKKPVYKSLKDIAEDTRFLNDIQRSCCYLFTSAYVHVVSRCTMLEIRHIFLAKYKCSKKYILHFQNQVTWTKTKNQQK